MQLPQKKTITTLIGLVIIQFLVEIFFARVYPDMEFSFARSLLIGVVTLASLLTATYIFKNKFIEPFIGAFSILSSAYFGGMLVQGGYLIGKSAMSGVTHIAIIVVSYFILKFGYKAFKGR